MGSRFDADLGSAHGADPQTATELSVLIPKLAFANAGGVHIQLFSRFAAGDCGPWTAAPVGQLYRAARRGARG